MIDNSLSCTNHRTMKDDYGYADAGDDRSDFGGDELLG